uniref:Secreted protein n=1 Tax=Caenorhabditis japonica TaxID=281687 RepID=A0A8R1IUY3_CAEJA
MRYLIPLFTLFACLHAQTDPCADAPTETAKILCRQIHKWDDGARVCYLFSFFLFSSDICRRKCQGQQIVTGSIEEKKIALPPGLAKGMAAEFAPIASTIYQCMDLPCLCSYLRGTATANGGCTLPNGQPLQKSVRKEYRMLTDDERNRFHAAFR